MKIKRISIPSSKSSCSKSWLEFWENYSGRKPTLCSIANCVGTDLIGVHVKKSGLNSDRKWYVCPVCGEHAKASRSSILELWSSAALVPIDSQEQ